MTDEGVGREGGGRGVVRRGEGIGEEICVEVLGCCGELSGEMGVGREGGEERSGVGFEEGGGGGEAGGMREGGEGRGLGGDGVGLEGEGG